MFIQFDLHKKFLDENLPDELYVTFISNELGTSKKKKWIITELVLKFVVIRFFFLHVMHYCL